MAGGGPKEQVVTNKLDPATERWNEEIRNRTRGVSNQPYTPYTGQTVAGADPRSIHGAGGMSGMPNQFEHIGNQAMYGDRPNTQPYEQAGAIGASALGGDQAATDRLMNPYMKNVVGAMGTEYDRMRDKATMGANDQATQGGAFGGSRHALMTGERLGAIDRAQGSEMAGLLHGGFNDAMSRAGSAAGMGLSANDMRSRHGLGAAGLGLDAGRAQMDAYGQEFGMGDYFRGINQQGLDDKRGQFNEQRDWGLRGLDIMRGTSLPYGTSQSQPMTRGNRFGSMAGGAASGFALGGPIGAGIGGLGGLLFG